MRIGKLQIALLVLGAAIVLAGFTALALKINSLSRERPARAAEFETSGEARIGGPFSLVNQHGEAVTEKTFLGKPTVYFFGYTHCPDVCPTTLAELAHQLELLGSDSDRLNVVFVTVDPERDSSEHLALYLSSFGARMIGLTGSEENIRRMAKAFAVHFGTIKDKDGDMVVHTASAFLMDRQGRFLALIRYDEERESVTAKLRKALAS